MEAKATARYIRMSPRKVRLVVDLIRGRRAQEADQILRYLNKRAARPVRKVLKSAMANAVNNHDMLEEALYVKAAWVDEGPAFKRLLPRARGRADIIKKRTSHITVVLEERHGE